MLKDARILTTYNAEQIKARWIINGFTVVNLGDYLCKVRPKSPHTQIVFEMMNFRGEQVAPYRVRPCGMKVYLLPGEKKNLYKCLNPDYPQYGIEVLHNAN